MAGASCLGAEAHANTADEERCLRELLLRERREREAAFAALGEAVDERVRRVGEGLVQVLLEQAREEREASVAELRSELEAQLVRAAPGAGSPGLAAAEELLEQARREQEAAFAQLRAEMEVRLARFAEEGQLAAALERERSERNAGLAVLRGELGLQLARAAEADACPSGLGLAELLERERSERMDALAALRSEVDARLASATQQEREAMLDIMRREIRRELDEAPRAARDADGPASASLAGDASGTRRPNACEVSRALSRQQSEAAQLEEQMEKFRRDIANSVQVLRLQVAQVEQVSSTLDMDVRILKEAAWPSQGPAEPPDTGALPPPWEPAPLGTAERSEWPTPARAGQTPLGTASPLGTAGSLCSLGPAPSARRPLAGRRASCPDAPVGTAGPEGLGGLVARVMSKTLSLAGGAAEAAAPRPPAVVPMGLSEYLLRDPQGEAPIEHPAGYRAEPEGDRVLLVHRGSGVKLMPVPLQLAGALDTDLLLYHYTDRDSFRAICEAPEVLVALLPQARRGDAEFGAGVYMTIHAPEHFGTRSAILANMHSNAEDRAAQLREIEPHCGGADYCVPFLVRRCHVRDVMREATPEMASGAGFTAAGERVRAGRDVRVVFLDPVEEAARQLEDPAAAVRARAAKSLRELSSRGDGRAVGALLPCLGAERDAAVRAAVVGALGEVAQRGDAAACAALQRCLSAQGNGPAVREAAALALGKVAQRGDHQAVEVLARCLDGDPDRAVRASAAFVLGRVAPAGDARAIEALTYRFEDGEEDERVSAVAGQALRRLGLDVDEDEEAADEKACIIS